MKSPLLETVKKGSYTAQLETRLRKVLNIMHFLLTYYSQFHTKLTQTIERLDADAVSRFSILMPSIIERESEDTYRCEQVDGTEVPASEKQYRQDSQTAQQSMQVGRRDLNAEHLNSHSYIFQKEIHKG